MTDTRSPQISILAIEDDPGDFGLIRAHARLGGLCLDDSLHWGKTLAEGMALCRQHAPEVVLLDLSLPDSAGLKTIEALRRAFYDLPIVVLTGHDDLHLAVAALEAGAQDYLVKGQFDQDALGRAVRHAVVRNRLELRLRQLETAVNAAANAIFITDDQAQVQWANPAFAELTGYTLAEAIGRKPSELIKSGLQDNAFYQAMWDTILAGKVWRGEVINRRRDGTLYDEALSISPVLSGDGSVRNFVAVKQDISERKTAARAAEQNTRQLQLVLEGGELGFFDWHIPSGRITVNERANEMFGVPDGSVGWNWEYFRSLVHPTDWPVVQDAVNDHLSGKTSSYEAEVRLFHKDNRWVWMLGRGAVMERDAAGAPLRMVGTLQDTSERKSAMVALQVHQTHLANLIASLQDLVIMLDTEGMVSELHCPADHAFAEFAAIPQGSYLPDLAPPALGDFVATGIVELFTGSISCSKLLTLTVGEDSNHFEVTLSHLVHSGPYPQGYLLVVADVTRRTIAEQMTRSASTIPHVTNFDDADVTELERLRQGVPAGQLSQNIKLTMMPFVMKAVAMVLRRHSALNAVFDEQNDQILYKEYVNLGIAVDTPRGLVVPNVRNADRLTILQLAKTLGSIAERARSSQFGIDELRGGTFTISNLGAVGGSYSTPIINYPEVAVLLLGRARWLPVVRGENHDRIETRQMLPLSLSYDHRLVDGGTAGRFLNEVIRNLETPGMLLLA